MADQKPFDFDKEHPRNPTYEAQFSDDPTPAYKLYRQDGPDPSRESAEAHSKVTTLETQVHDATKR